MQYNDFTCSYFTFSMKISVWSKDCHLQWQILDWQDAIFEISSGLESHLYDDVTNSVQSYTRD